MVPSVGLVVAAIVGLLHQTAALEGGKPISAVLDANWRSTPLMLEISEFMASESNPSFWSFVDSVTGSHVTSDKDEYETGLAALQGHLSTLEMDMLKFALSVRFHSPAVQAFQQVAEEHIRSRSTSEECVAFASLAGRDFCSAADLMEAVTGLTTGEEATAQLYDFDHVFPGSHQAPVTVVVYGRLGTPALHALHAVVKPLAESGKVRYALRHYVQRSELQGRDWLRMSGFGVELAIKSTEYKAVDDSAVKEGDAGTPSMGKEEEDEVEGFIFGILKNRFPESGEDLRKFRAHMVESTNQMAPLKVWQLQDLSFQASQRILSSDASDALRIMRDISQNIPMLARSLSKTRVTSQVRSEISANQKILGDLGVDPGSSVFFLNGMLLRLDAMDPFNLISLFKSESKAMHGLSNVGIGRNELQHFLGVNVHSSHDSFGVDMRGDAVQYINNLETDSEYARFSPYVQQMLYGIPSGVLRQIRKNIFHAVFCVNPVDAQSIRIIRAAHQMIVSNLPARIGLLFVAGGAGEVDAKENAAAGLLRVYKYVQSNQGGRAALQWLDNFYASAGEDFEASDVFKKATEELGEDVADELFSVDADEDTMRRLGNRFFQRKGLGSLPRLVVNGQLFDLQPGQDVRKAVIEACESLTQPLQQQVYMGEIGDWTNLEERFYGQPNVKKRYNEFVFAKDATILNLAATQPDASAPLTDLGGDQITARVLAGLRYAHTSDDAEKARLISAIVVTDLQSEHGQAMVTAALKQAQRDVQLRATFLHRPSSDSTQHAFVARATQAVLLSQSPSVAAQCLVALMGADGQAARNGEEEFLALAKAVVGFDSAAFQSALGTVNGDLELHAHFASHVLRLHSDQSAVVANGKVLGPLSPERAFTAEDFLLVQEFDMDLYGLQLQRELDNTELAAATVEGETESHARSNVLMKIASVLKALPRRQRHTGLGLKREHSAMHLQTGTSQFSYDIMAVIDPLTESAQRLAPLLQVLQNVTSVDITVYMNPRSKLSEVPVKRFYRYVLEPSLEFTSSGTVSNAVAAVFTDLPEAVLLTLKMDVPQPWMVESVQSAYDLDNIRLQDVEQAVVSNFQLIAMVIEGHCSDINTGAPTRGLQVVLGTPSQPDRVDTIVMANMGYFQLKASPGAWGLRLRSGRSNDIFSIEETVGAEVNREDGSALVIVTDFNGKFVQISVQKRPGKEEEDVLEGGGEEAESGFWGNMLGNNNDGYEAETDEVINVFSIASGHLYERFLRIMMLSVVKNTKTPVKFWFLQNFLSPQFKDFIPQMAAEYGFQYELVQYKWPHWLHQQTEKQRVIWGYKILFLDVLFPLNINRIIYVDADQTVRSDLKELMTMDLDGAPYAYTPFCSDRPEMDGFRFWKSGYWASHLAGLPYHISALYVVDLKRFRRLAAGDRLRGQYQGLSQDPNSLANLDQDLPNNMIHQVKIKSLPQEWLWCETWCSNSSKPAAKTIDLCNNPQTKEPKLSAALRIVPEWSSYDQEVRALQDRLESGDIKKSASSESTVGDPAHSHDEF